MSQKCPKAFPLLTAAEYAPTLNEATVERISRWLAGGDPRLRIAGLKARQQRVRENKLWQITTRPVARHTVGKFVDYPKHRQPTPRPPDVVLVRSFVFWRQVIKAWMEKKIPPATGHRKRTVFI